MRSLAAFLARVPRALCCAAVFAGAASSAAAQATRASHDTAALGTAARTRASAPAVTASSDTAYVPSQDFPNGREVVAVYFGANWCGPCRSPATKAAIQRMKPLLATQAETAGAGFAAMVVALDRSFADGAAFIKDLGAFDEYSIGSDLASTAAQAYIWSDSLAIPAVPQVIVFERDVRVQRGRPMTFGPRHVLARVAGDSIAGWVRAGAPLHLEAARRVDAQTPPRASSGTSIATTTRSTVHQSLSSPAVLEDARMRLELIGLHRWTVAMVQDSLRRYAPEASLLSHACAAILREKLHFADAAVQVYPASYGGNAREHVVVTVIEPQDSARVRYRAVPRDTAPLILAWAAVHEADSAATHAFQDALQIPGVLRSDTMAMPDTVLRKMAGAVAPLRAFLRAHTRPADEAQALHVLATDGNTRNRAAAVVILTNFTDDDRAWWALADALRDPVAMVNVYAQMALVGLAREHPHRVDWAPAAPTLRAVLNGTNLYAQKPLAQALVATAVSPALAPALLRGGGDILIGTLAASEDDVKHDARSLLVRLAGRDLGDDPAAWREWVTGL